MKSRVLLFALLSFATVLLTTSCQKDEDEPAPKFKVTVTNGRAETYDVHYKIDFATGTFQKAGTLAAGQSLELTNLNTNLTYIIRIVLPNAPVDPAVDEEKVSSTGMDVGVTFN